MRLNTKLKENLAIAVEILLGLFVMACCYIGADILVHSVFGYGKIGSIAANVVSILASAFIFFLSYRASSAEAGEEMRRADAEKYEKLYWEYEKRCRDAELELLSTKAELKQLKAQSAE